ncbi:hypothetical protein B0T22DRAFT_499138 [Podospora appendiculata]|uniref:FAD-binding PCMH-type domain-containing protein n=1 Tax=Podospora appendiculata TaxID=314037 RepID=A0AAE0XB15_9PEZI|nr:hypothetical protein B0T22DRAFT_499138 [Podospora appendiculata]
MAYVAWITYLPFEKVQLTQADAGNFTAIKFGNHKLHHGDQPRCRAFPGSEDWPAESEWKQLNDTLEGALLRPIHAASACYQGDYYNATTCAFLVQRAGRTHFWVDDPYAVLTQWMQGNTCLPTASPVGNCTRGGSPEYVVNATTVKHIQAAVNFARNKNVRLVIKNTGHDFGGRSTGAGSLSVWVHNLKSVEFSAEYSSVYHSGNAIRIGAGLESWEFFTHMAKNNITVVSPGGSTVGAVGGWMLGGGHGVLTSKYGMGSDQVLSINLVTADGKFLTADSTTNTDLFWALRGSGVSTFGIVTSVVMRAFPPINNTNAGAISFSISPPPVAGPPAPPFAALPVPVNSTETFWKGINIVYRFSTSIVDAGGYCYTFIYPLGNNTYLYNGYCILPGVPVANVSALMQPLIDQLNAVGVNVTAPPLTAYLSSPYAGASRIGSAPPGEPLAQTRYHSRLFPRANWEDDALFEKTMAAIRAGVEEGQYNFHGIAYSPTEQVAGMPGADSAVNPAWRKAVLHASLMELQPVGLTALEATAVDAKAKKYLDLWRAVTPGAGAYINEGDPAEPGWQQSFYGEHYSRLLRIKWEVDPYGVFWAPTTVGSEAFEVVTVDGYPSSQNGRLCRVEK